MQVFILVNCVEYKYHVLRHNFLRENLFREIVTSKNSL